MNDYFHDFKTNMVIKNFSESTITSYSYELKKYFRYCENEEKSFNSASFKEFLYNNRMTEKLSAASLKQSIGAVKFFLSTH